MQKKCSFCGNTDIEHDVIIEKNNVSVCSKCVEKMYRYIDSRYGVYGGHSALKNTFKAEAENKESTDKSLADNSKSEWKFKTPSKIKAMLDDYVIGQESAKRVLSIAAYNHYKRIENQGDSEPDDGIEIQKSNIMLVGPTGCGKTYLAQTLSKILDVPFAIYDATGLTEAGYVGDDIENIITKLCERADWDIERAEKGIVYIDEIDKISTKGGSTSTHRDVGGEGVQQSLLKLVEGTEITIKNRIIRGPGGSASACIVDTTNILFICGGAFDGLKKSAKKSANGIGFGSVMNLEEESASSDIQPSDIIAYGMMPEFVGRFPVLAVLSELDKASIKAILTTPKNAITKQYVKLMKMDGVDIEFTNKALDKIAEEALQKGIGARGLRSILEKTMENIMFNVPDIKGVRKVLVDESTVSTGKMNLYDSNNKKISQKNKKGKIANG